MLLTGDSGDADVLAWTPADAVVYAELRLDLPGDQHGRARRGHAGVPGLRRPGRVPDQAQRGARPARQLGDRRRAVVDDRTSSRGSAASCPSASAPLPGVRSTTYLGARALVLASVTDAAKAQAWADEIVTSGTLRPARPPRRTTARRSPSSPAASGDAKPMAPKGLRTPSSGRCSPWATSRRSRPRSTPAARRARTVEQFQEAEIDASRRPPRAVVRRRRGTSSTAPRRWPATPASLMPNLPAVANEPPGPSAPSVSRTRVHHRDPHPAPRGARPGRSLPTDARIRAAADDRVPRRGPRPRRETLTIGSRSCSPRSREMAERPEAARPRAPDRGAGSRPSPAGWARAASRVTRDGDRLGGGDRHHAHRRRGRGAAVHQLRGLLDPRRAARPGLSVSDEDYNGTTITTVQLGNLEGVEALAVPIPAELKVSYAVTDEVVVLGVGTDFTRPSSMPATGGARSRRPSASPSRWPRPAPPTRPVLGRCRRSPRPRRDAAVREDKAEYEADVKPYLEAFDSVIGTFTPGTDLRPRHASSSRVRRLISRHHHPTAQSDADPAQGPCHGGAPHTHGRSHPPDPRRRDQAADLPACRRRQPFRPRRARDRHDRALQPPHRPDRAPDRRGQGQGLAVEGRPAAATPSAACSSKPASLPAAK